MKEEIKKQVDKIKEEEKINIELKQKKHWAQTEIIKKILAETSRNNSKEIRRIRFITEDDIEITFKPQKQISEVQEQYGLTTTTQATDLYNIADLKDQYPVIFELAKLVKKEPVEVVLSYMEKEFYNEREQEIETYYFMNDKDAQTIYCEKIHKDKDNLNQQLDAELKSQKRKELE